MGRAGLDQILVWISAVVVSLAAAGSVYFLLKTLAPKAEQVAARADELIDKEPPLLDLERLETEKNDTSDHHENAHALTKNSHSPDSESVSKELTRGALTNAKGLWSYGGAKGPQRWMDTDEAYLACGLGRRQSPVDIKDPQRSRDVPRLLWNPGKARGTYFHRLGLAGLLVESHPGKIVIDDEPQKLLSLYFRVPSEHKVDGIPYAMELQFLLQDDRKNLAMVAFFVQEGVSGSKELQRVLPRLPKKDDFPTEDFAIDLSEIRTQNPSYYFYLGSLPFPPCTEKVSWFISQTPLNLPAAIIDKFIDRVKLNSRPIQATSGRKILRSWNG